MLKHKGIFGSVNFDGEVYWGKFLNVEGLITYEADSLDDLGEEFEEVVEEYLEELKSDELE